MKFSCQCSIPNPKAKAASAFVTYLPWELRYSTFRSLTRPLLCSMLINAPNLGAAHNFASTDAYSNIIVRHGGITVKKKRRPKGLPFRESVPKEPQKHTTAYGTLPCNCRKVFTHKDLATADRGGGYLNYFSSSTEISLLARRIMPLSPIQPHQRPAGSPARFPGVAPRQSPCRKSLHITTGRTLQPRPNTPGHRTAFHSLLSSMSIPSVSSWFAAPGQSGWSITFKTTRPCWISCPKA